MELAEALAQLAAISPRSVVFVAYQKVETALYDLARGTRPDLVEEPIVVLLKELERHGVIPRAVADICAGLRKSRNQVVHIDDEVAVSAADDYAESALLILDDLDRRIVGLSTMAWPEPAVRGRRGRPWGVEASPGDKASWRRGKHRKRH